MDGRQPSKRRKQAAEDMEEDLFRSSRRGSVGRPTHDESPRTTLSAVPTTIWPLPSNETGQGASSARSVPPPEGNAAPVADAPTGLFYDGTSYAGMRGAYPEGYEHGENYGGRLATRFNSLLFDDDEAVSRVEGYFITRGRPRGWRLMGARSAVHFPAPEATLRTPFDGRERESQSSQALERIKRVMARMEHHGGLDSRFSGIVRAPSCAVQSG
jgi:hypothetical protein